MATIFQVMPRCSNSQAVVMFLPGTNRMRHFARSSFTTESVSRRSPPPRNVAVAQVRIVRPTTGFAAPDRRRGPGRISRRTTCRLPSMMLLE